MESGGWHVKAIRVTQGRPWKRPLTAAPAVGTASERFPDKHGKLRQSCWTKSTVVTHTQVSDGNPKNESEIWAEADDDLCATLFLLGKILHLKQPNNDFFFLFIHLKKILLLPAALLQVIRDKRSASRERPASSSEFQPLRRVAGLGLGPNPSTPS